MTNALIRLDNATTIVADFQQLLQTHNHVLLVVLGNTAAHLKLADDAVPYTDAGDDHASFRYVVLVPEPQLLYTTTIVSLPVDPDCEPLPANCQNLYGVSIAMDGTVCDLVKDTSISDINLAFMMAETHIV